MAARIQTTPALTISTPVRLFDARDYEPLAPPRAGGAAGRTFDVAPDGRFLMIKDPSKGSGEVTLIQNWVDELKRSGN